MSSFDQETILNFIAKQFSEGFKNYPEEIKQALQNTEVLILREDKQIRIVARSLIGQEEEARQVAKGLGNAVIPLLARIIGGFKCKVKYQP